MMSFGLFYIFNFNLSIVVLLIFYPKKQKFEKIKQRKVVFFPKLPEIKFSKLYPKLK